MINIIVSASGKLKEPYWISACEEYIKRLGRYAKITIIQCSEGECPAAPAGSYVIACSPTGKQYSSEDFSENIQNLQVNGVSKICFLIGDSNGLTQTALNNADELVSFSSMTWPHHMFRAMLLEQIYRAFSIINNGKYHK